MSEDKYHGIKAVMKKKLKNFYQQEIANLLSFLISPGKTVLKINHNTNKSVKSKKIDFIIVSDVIGDLPDIQSFFEQTHKQGDERTRIIVTYYNFLWEPIIILAQKLGIKSSQETQNWLSTDDIKNLLFLSNFEVIKSGNRMLLPFYIPFISTLFNRYLSQLPILKNLCLIQFIVAKKTPIHKSKQDFSVSVIIPARNESGNIEQAVIKMPRVGKRTELIFVEGGSSDDTLKEIKRVIRKYPKKKITLVKQNKGIGKGDAVRKGFNKAKGDILMILDADLTVSPSDIPKFYNALKSGKGEFINGTRLVYPMEKQAMRFLNILGNKLFSIMFSWLLDQRIKDTLCGTKVLFRRDYLEIAKNRSYFGNFDPFGDFDLLFGAAKMNLKIVEVPVRYKARTYGSTNISRFKHGLLLLRMTVFGARKIKFI